MNIRKGLNIIFWVVIACAGFLYYFFNQSIIEYELCPTCDSWKYLSMYDYFNSTSSEFPSIEFPFNQRIMVPFLASLFTSSDAFVNYQNLNLIFTALTVIFLYLTWKKLKFKPILTVFGLFWLLFHWSGIIRYYAFDPVSVDVGVYFFEAILLYLLVNRKYLFIAILTPIMVLTKESFLAYFFVLMVLGWAINSFYGNSFPKYLFIVIFSLALVTSILVNVYMEPKTSANSLERVLFYAKNVLKNPTETVRWVVCIFTAFGATIILAIQNIRKNYSYDPDLVVILGMSLVSLLFGLVAGEDRTRILFVSAPIVLTSIFYLLNSRGNGVILTSIVLSTPLMLIFNEIPPISQLNYHNSIYPEFASPGTVAIWGIYMMLSYFILKKTDQYLNS